MFRSLACYALVFGVVVSAPGVAAADRTVTLPRATFPVGTVMDTESTSTTEMDFTITPAGAAAGHHHWKLHKTRHLREEVLAVTGAICTRERLTYVDEQQDDTIDGKPTPPFLPRPVKTIIRERRGDKLILTDEKGAPLPPDEEAEEIRHSTTFGLPSPTNDLIQGHRLTIGKTLQLSAEAATAFAFKGSKVTVHRATMTPAAPHGQLVDFQQDVELRDSPGPEGMMMSAHYTGPVTYETKYGQQTDMALHAVITPSAGADLAKKGTKVTGSGAMDITSKSTVTLPIKVTHGGKPGEK